MSYVLQQLGAGNYDLLLNGNVIGSVVRNTLPSGHDRGWRAELAEHDDDAWKPHPFTKSEHEFDTLVDATNWLGKTMIIPKQSRRSKN